MNKNQYPSQIAHELIEVQAKKVKENIAVFTVNEEMSYGTLNDRANQLAHYLLDTLKVMPGEPVGVCTTHEPARVLLLLAISKAGASYVPIDPFYPDDLINYMTDKISAKTIFTDRVELMNKQAGLDTSLINIKTLALNEYSTQNPGLTIASDSPLYIIFTSGSTGKPKAVAVSHDAAYNHFNWVMRYTKFDTSDIWLQTINPSFDPSMHELMAPLMLGGRIALIGGAGALSNYTITDAIIKTQATHITTVPTMLTLLVDTPDFSRCTSLKQVCVGGEVFRPALAMRAYERLPKTVFHNVYGPTEATIMASGWKITAPEQRDALPIGEPIDHMRFYVLTDEGDVVKPSPGVMGELLMSGISLANGYVNDNIQTEDKFRQNPLEQDPDSIYNRLYYSGDRCSVDENGDVFCLGRLDEQVKINGRRIELAEIAYPFSELDDIKDVAAVVIENQLVVALVPSKPVQDETVWLAHIQTHIEKKLPASLLPKRMIIVDVIPGQSVSAKADRKLLIEMLTNTLTQPALSKPPKPEEKLVQVVQDIIKDTLDDDSDKDMSFADLGFDSVNLQTLTLKINQLYQTEIRVEDLFEYYNINKLSAFIACEGA
ncbi:MAG: non-ribosomal peptide synthetase [Gammaproteobacteria bacterium]|nr:non-ribosomal peptide synthetase [Gammaproteobacteria bacterium]